jgi:'Cold-shock' DNA-binding domain
MALGTFKWFDVESGYGLISPDDGGRNLFARSTDWRLAACSKPSRRVPRWPTRCIRTQLARGQPKSAPVLGVPELQAMARREFAVSPWDLRRLGVALALTEAEMGKLSHYYFGLN